MIEEVCVPPWMVTLARMTRRQVRLGSIRGYGGLPVAATLTIIGRTLPSSNSTMQVDTEDFAETTNVAEVGSLVANNRDIPVHALQDGQSTEGPGTIELAGDSPAVTISIHENHDDVLVAWVPSPGPVASTASGAPDAVPVFSETVVTHHVESPVAATDGSDPAMTPAEQRAEVRQAAAPFPKSAEAEAAVTVKTEEEQSVVAEALGSSVASAVATPVVAWVFHESGFAAQAAVADMPIAAPALGDASMRLTGGSIVTEHVESPARASEVSEPDTTRAEQLAEVPQAVASPIVPAATLIAVVENPETELSVEAPPPEPVIASTAAPPVVAWVFSSMELATQEKVAEVPTTESTLPTPVNTFTGEMPVLRAAVDYSSTIFAAAPNGDYNRIGLNYRRPMPWPKVNGGVIDAHCHILSARHADVWFEAADHYGLRHFVTMTPLEEAVSLQRNWGHRLHFVAVPKWADTSDRWVDDWLTCIETFHNIGSRIAKFHAAPGTMAARGCRLDDAAYRPLLRAAADRGMAIMTHIGDPDLWYAGKYGATADLQQKFGTRDEHYRMWEGLLEEFRGTPWLGAHLGGNPEELSRLQRLLDRFPDLWLDCSATRWMVREISLRRGPARDFMIHNQDRILFGSDQVSMDDRGFDFLASRFWCHRKLWETTYDGPSPITDPDLPEDGQPVLRGLALPDNVLQKLYHDNAERFLTRVGASFADDRACRATR